MTYEDLKKSTNPLTSPMTHPLTLLACLLAFQVFGCKGDLEPQTAAPAQPSSGLQTQETPASAAEPAAVIEEIRGSIAAINARKWTEAAGVYLEDAQWLQGGQTDAQPLVGRNAVAEVWRDLAQWIPDVTVVPTRIVAAGDRVIVETWTGGTTGSSVRSLGLAKGAKVGVLSVEVFTMRGRSVAQVTSYGDGSALRAQLKGDGTPAPKPDGPAQVHTGPVTLAPAELLEAQALEAADWGVGVPGVWVVAKGAALSVLTVDDAGSVTQKTTYSSVP